MDSGVINSHSPELLKWIDKKKIELSSRKGPNALATREKLDSVAKVIRKSESAIGVADSNRSIFSPQGGLCI